MDRRKVNKANEGNDRVKCQKREGEMIKEP